MPKTFTILTDEEIATVIAQADHYGAPDKRQMWRALFLLLGNLGLRITEAITMRWQDVNFERGEATVRTLKQRPRNGKSIEDTLPVDASTLAALAAWRNGAQPQDRIFPVSRRYAYNVWQHLLHLAVMRPVKMHALRHSAVTRWIEQTGDLALAQALARHKSVATTALYVHVRNLKEKFKSITPIG